VYKASIKGVGVWESFRAQIIDLLHPKTLIFDTYQHKNPTVGMVSFGWYHKTLMFL
jgi:hypothetical protein